VRLCTCTAYVLNPNGLLAYTHLLADRVEKTTSIEKKTMDIEERGVKLRLTVVDTPGKYSRTLLW
jgi:septin family protein